MWGMEPHCPCFIGHWQARELPSELSCRKDSYKLSYALVKLPYPRTEHSPALQREARRTLVRIRNPDLIDNCSQVAPFEVNNLNFS
jgi:hypothetical protein